MKLTAQQHRRLVGNLTGNGEKTARNAANRQEGADFEKRLDSYHAELMAANKAQVMRTNPKIRMTGPGRAAMSSAKVNAITWHYSTTAAWYRSTPNHVPATPLAFRQTLNTK